MGLIFGKYEIKLLWVFSELSEKMIWSLELLVLVTLTFLLAGTVKGVIGMALPTVSLGVLAAILGLKDAIVLMLVPSFVTNVWQGVIGGYFLPLFKRLWIFHVFPVWNPRLKRL